MNYIYEPNASIMKAGCYAELERRFEVKQLTGNSHLFAAETEIEDFPGRGFRVEAIHSLKEAQQAFKGQQANVATRNFPLKAEELKKKLKVRDGGELYLFGTTLADGKRVVVAGRKVTRGMGQGY